MNGYIFTTQPVLIASVVLAVTEWTFSIHFTDGVVFLTEMLERFAFSGKSAADFFRIEIPKAQFRRICLPCDKAALRGIRW